MREESRIRIVLVGLGRIADLHAAAYRREPRARLHGVCDARPEVAAQRAAAWGVQQIYHSLEEVLADPRVDAVEILTPTHLHAEMVTAAAAAGKHVSVQKPMALSVADGRRMVAACAAAGVVFKVCENYVFYPPLLRARRAIESGAIAQVLNVGLRMVGAARGGWPVAAESWQWRLREAQLAGGPTTFDHGHHMFAVAWLLGGEIDQLHAWINRLDGTMDAPATIHWNYTRQPAQGSVQFVVAPEMRIPAPYYSNDEWFEVVGTRGILWVNRCTAHLRGDLPAVVLYRDGELRDLEEPAVDWGEGFRGALGNFVDAIRGSARPCLDAADGLRMLATDLAAQRSARLGRAVYVQELLPPEAPAGVPEWLVGVLWPLLVRFRRMPEQRRRRRQAPGGGRAAGDERWWQRLLGTGGDDQRWAPRCRDLMAALPERFDGEAVADWRASIALEVTGEGGGAWTVRFDAGEMSLVEELEPEADLYVRVPAGTWAAILAGKRRAEIAFVRGKLRVVSGNPEMALPLRRAFHI
jgi:predicted dehydrogenase/putative sterol carrier protein